MFTKRVLIHVTYEESRREKKLLHEFVSVERSDISGVSGGFDIHHHAASGLWTDPRTAWRYIGLVKVVSPDSEGDSMIEGVPEFQYR